VKISGNTVLITGGSSGIGLALAEAFLAMDNKVLICGRRESRLIQAQQDNPDLHYMVCDVTKQEDRESLFAWATTEFDVNVLINNAGIQCDVDFTKGIEELVSKESEIKVNFETPVYLSAQFIPHLMCKKEGAIINVTSGLAFMTSPRAIVPLYVATKAAIHSFTSLLRKQLAETSVEVIEIIPPIVDTEINPEGRAKRKTAPKGIQPEEYVSIVMKGLSEGLQIIPSAPNHYPQPLTLLDKRN